MALLDYQEGSELERVISGVSRDKNLDKSVIVDALEQAVVHAGRRVIGVSSDLEAHYNEEADEIELFQFRTVVEDDDVANDEMEIALADAMKLDSESVLGDALGVKIDTSTFGRIAAQSAKQIIVQKVRDAERAQVYEEFKDRVGEIMSGNVRRLERNDIIVDLGRSEAVIPYKEQVPTEKFRPKDRIQAYVVDVKKSSRGPQIIMSRAHSGFLVSLFEQHVTEIYDGIVSIESAARDPGFRSKIAVYSKDNSVDPVGACVGMKGARVQAVVAELNGEKIDIVPFDHDPARLVCNALAPAVVKKVIVDDGSNSMEVIVSDDQLSLAIGKRGQNVRLAAQLTGWRLDIKSESSVEEKMSGAKAIIAGVEGLDDMMASLLVQEGYGTVEEIAGLAPRVLLRVLNLDHDSAMNVIRSAQEIIGSQDPDLMANSSAAPVEDAKVDHGQEEKSDLINVFLELSDVGEANAHALAEGGYGTIGDLIADSAEEISQKTGLSLGVARTIQMAADRYMQDG
ncbi:MAG: transcription termination/antitermination protein NusA [Zetaproteobacteria bacterium]|nr:transcription termination/antitermination protein NusA [Pseudobdellovibrionaceae bacterium]